MREDLIERLLTDADLIHDNGITRKLPRHRVAALLREAAAALEAAREDAWQPIETAPKDGTRIMLGNEHGSWMAEHRPVYLSGYRPDCPWFCVMLNRDHIAREHRYKTATHWRPIPAIDQARGKGVAGA